MLTKQSHRRAEDLRRPQRERHVRGNGSPHPATRCRPERVGWHGIREHVSEPRRFGGPDRIRDYEPADVHRREHGNQRRRWRAGILLWHIRLICRCVALQSELPITAGVHLFF